MKEGLCLCLAMCIGTAWGTQQWWENPVIKSTVKTGVKYVSGNAVDPHYMNKSTHDKYLLVNFSANAPDIPFKLYNMQRLIALNGAVADDQAVASQGSASVNVKGCAISDDLNVGVLGSATEGNTTRSILATNATWSAGGEATVGTWTLGSNEFAPKFSSGAPDGIDFSPDSKYLYSNNYTTKNQVLQMSNDTYAAAGTLTLTHTFSSSNMNRIRNVNVYSIGGKDLVYYGEGSNAGNVGRICVLDTSTWTETVLLASDTTTFPVVAASEIMNVKVSGFGSGQLYLYVCCDGGQIVIYKLDSNGLELGDQVKVITPAETMALLGSTSGTQKFRNFEVSNDGRYAFLTCNPGSYNLANNEATVNVIYTKPAAFKQWFVNPHMQASINTGVSTNSSDPHYMNKSAGDKYLMINFNAGGVGAPVTLYSIPALINLYGAKANAAAAIASGTSSTSLYGAAYKGGAVSDDINVGLVGRGDSDAFVYGTVLTTNAAWMSGTVGSWTKGGNSFQSTASGAAGAADGWDFSSDGKFLYSQCYKDGYRGLIYKYRFDTLTSATAANNALTVVKTNATTSGILRIRNISLYNVAGRDLIYYGEGKADSKAGGTVCVLDTSKDVWEEKVLITDTATYPTGNTSDIMNVKVSGFGSDQLYLYVCCDGGKTVIYKLSFDGLTIGEKVATITEEQMLNLADCTHAVSTGHKYRNFEVSNDGRYAFLAESSAGNYYVPKDGTGMVHLTVVSSESNPATVFYLGGAH